MTPAARHESHPDCRAVSSRLSRDRKRASDRGALREGPALLQGLAVCGHCGRSMSSRYNKSWRYICSGRMNALGSHDGCFSVGGVRIDRLVSQCFLEAVGPAGLEAALQAEQQVVVERKTALRSYRLELERCTYEASLAERRYRQVDPDNRLIAATLEREWEQALRALERAQQQLEVAEAEQPRAPDPKRLASLGRDLPALWEAEETTARDRKRLRQADHGRPVPVHTAPEAGPKLQTGMKAAKVQMAQAIHRLISEPNPKSAPRLPATARSTGFSYPNAANPYPNAIGGRTGAGKRFRSAPRERRRSPRDEPPAGRGLPVDDDARKTAVKSEAMSVCTGSERSWRCARMTQW